MQRANTLAAHAAGELLATIVAALVLLILVSPIFTHMRPVVL